MLKKSVIAAASIAVAAFAQPAAAQTPYVGVSFGTSDYKDACQDVSGPGISCDDKATAWRIFGGYQFNRHFAAELAYHNLGEIEASNSFGAKATIKATTWDLVGVGLLPFGTNFAGYGKLGLYYGKTEASSNFGISGDDTNTGLTWGLGVQWDPMPPLGLRLEWQQYNDVGGDDSGKGNINVLSLNALWRFR